MSRAHAAPSRILLLRDGHERFGEWRGSGMQTVIAGPHPCGRPYTNNGRKPITVEFSAIGWPEIVALPWDMKRPGGPRSFWRRTVSDTSARRKRRLCSSSNRAAADFGFHTLTSKATAHSWL